MVDQQGGVCRLVVCFDGTWNNVESRTNVSRLFESIHDSGPDGSQLKFYDEGVGRAVEATTPWTRSTDALVGGIFGDGIVVNILQAYCWLIEHYAENALPEIFIFGFSRGAFTARLLAGLLGASGLLRKECVTACGSIGVKNRLVQAAWARYKPGRSAWRSLGNRDPAKLTQSAEREWDHYACPIAVKFLGVWDTVGRYGVPKFGWGGGLFKPIRFKDCSLGRHILNARHAMAIDEHRADFNVRLWDGVSESWSSERLVGLPKLTVVQRWFAGAHAQIGGGYQNDQLCHHPLRWMADEAHQAGLHLMRVGSPDTPTYRWAPLLRDHLAPVIDSHRAFALGLYRWISDPIIRQVRLGTVCDDRFTMRIDLDPSVMDKVLGDATYRPINLYHQGRLDVHSLSDLT